MMLTENEYTNEIIIADIYPDPNVPESPRVAMYQAEVGGMIAIDALVSSEIAADFLRLLATRGTEIDPGVAAE